MSSFLPSRSGRFRAPPAPATDAQAQLAAHLEQSIAEFSEPEPKVERPVMRGMKRLANLTTSLVQQMDAEADKAADEVQAAHDYAREAIGKFREQGKQIRQNADDMLAQLGQITNET